MAHSANRHRKRTRPRRPVGGPSRWWKVLNGLTAAAAAVLLLGVTTVVLSWGRPPRLGAEIVRVEPQDGGGAVLYGRVSGSFGALRRGFGQWIGPGGVDLLTADDRVLSLPGRIEELRWQALLWPPNWWRREVWFVEALPPSVGFERVRVHLIDRLGNPVLGPAVRLDRAGTPLEELPVDVRAWGRLEGLGAGLATPIEASAVELEAPRR